MSNTPPKAPVPPVYAHLPQWALGHSVEEADALCALVLDGKKTAIGSALYQFENEPPPEEGDRTVLLDGSGRPRCVIEFIEVDVAPFDEIDAAFAQADGASSLKTWQKTNQEAFTREGYFAPDMLLLCQHFRVIERLEFRRVAK